MAWLANSPHDDKTELIPVNRACLYLRVSSDDQILANQEADLRQLAAHYQLEIVKVIRETESGAKGDRAGLAALFEGARHREFDVLLLWALDRLSREGIYRVLGHLQALQGLRIRVISYRESWLDTQAPNWSLLVAVIAWVAEQERSHLSARVKAGMARAKAEGTRIGRIPRPLNLPEIARRRAAGHSWRHIARALKVPRRTLRRRWGETSPAA